MELALWEINYWIKRARGNYNERESFKAFIIAHTSEQCKNLLESLYQEVYISETYKKNVIHAIVPDVETLITKRNLKRVGNMLLKEEQLDSELKEGGRQIKTSPWNVATFE